MYRFYVENDSIFEKEIYISGQDVNHIKNVLRMKPQEKLIICDKAGKDYICHIKEFAENSVIVLIDEIKNSDTELPVKLYLFQGLPKKDKMELIIQKAVELGVFEIVPVMCKRTIVKLEDDKKEVKKLERWNTIAESAAKQSERGIIPKVSKVLSFKEAVKMAETLEGGIIPYENAADINFTKSAINEIIKKGSAGIFIGPEGGFEEEEIEFANKSGIIPITLGKRILRTETAGLAVLSILMFNIEAG